jgi:small multidrug resistance family-3 protein
MNFANFSAWIVFVLAACLEVGGDAVIRRGLRGGRAALVLAGCLVLACYGVMLNTVRWDFSKLMGVYIAIFALVSLLTARWVLREAVPVSTWIGLALVVAGGLVIQFGPRQ